MTHVLGVDFSGASDAGRRIWIAEGRLSDSRAFELSSCVAAKDLPGSGIDPEQAVPALARHIAALNEARIGCDFPFSLPLSHISARTWRSFALRYAAEFADAESFRSVMRSRHNAIEHKRMTDRIAGTPFNSYNLRLYRQTWWGITGLLQPLVRAGRAIVRPQQKLAAGKQADLTVLSLAETSLLPWEDPVTAVVLGGSPERVLGDALPQAERWYFTTSLDHDEFNHRVAVSPKSGASRSVRV